MVSKRQNSKLLIPICLVMFTAILLMYLVFHSPSEIQVIEEIVHKANCTPPRCVLQVFDPNFPDPCESSSRACDCTDGYRQFLLASRFQVSPTSLKAVNDSLRDIADGVVRPKTNPFSRNQLRDAIIDRINLHHLWDKIDNRLLKVVVVDDQDMGTYRKQKLIFIDPFVGEFEAILLLPKGKGHFSGIVGLHGHGDNAQVFIDKYLGRELVLKGFVFLAPTFRVMCGGASEGVVSKELLEQGFAFVGLRAYEVKLCLRYLASREDVDSDRLGLIGHSGGSVVGNLLVWLEPKIRAFVSDNETTYFREREYEDNYFDDLVPSLFPLHKQINDISNSSAEILKVPYAYKGVRTKIIDFFKEALLQKTEKRKSAKNTGIGTRQ